LIYTRKIPGICPGLFLEEYFSEVFPLQYLLHKKIPEKVKVRETTVQQKYLYIYSMVKYAKKKESPIKETSFCIL